MNGMLLKSLAAIMLALTAYCFWADNYSDALIGLQANEEQLRSIVAAGQKYGGTAYAGKCYAGEESDCTGTCRGSITHECSGSDNDCGAENASDSPTTTKDDGTCCTYGICSCFVLRVVNGVYECDGDDGGTGSGPSSYCLATGPPPKEGS